ncbi:hypothetical protein QYE76_035897 [Lolium multiflorum]|uniref:Uncharacterized protein n=1 Tax=Lolium multiflorum TaxID=4521 RepID=A0AAD8R3H6_LOLMU|nr:hypothetical protein QYE76_035897 [Lolium multiflorum]
MAINEQDGNGFPRRSLHAWKGHLLHQAGYPCPPNTRPPGGGWRLSAAACQSHRRLQGHALDVAIEEVRLNPVGPGPRHRHHPDNYSAWNLLPAAVGAGARLLRRPAAPASAQQRRWTPALVERAGSEPRGRPRTHRGQQLPVLTMPPPSRASVNRRRGSWQPRRMAASSSSSGSATRATPSSRSAPPLAPVKREPLSPSRNRQRSGGGIVIRDSSSPRGHQRLVRPKREPGTSDDRKRKPVKEEDHDAEEAAILEAVMERSLQDLVPAENAMPLEGAVGEGGGGAAGSAPRAGRSLPPACDSSIRRRRPRHRPRGVRRRLVQALAVPASHQWTVGRPGQGGSN